MFTVMWSRSASNQLTEAWLDADSNSRLAITRYVAQLERHLRANADRIGESRADEIRVLADGPIGLDFRVAESARMVTVVRVWFIRSRD